MLKKISLLQKLKTEYPQYTKDELTAFVVCKNVYVNNELIANPRVKIDFDSNIELSFGKYVSRGGLKLEKALNQFQIDVSNKVVLDAGSSTGGFSDCLLQNGAKCVHSVDVGYNQLAWKLRTDKRIIVHEKQNIMLVEELDPKPELAVCDLSFRSIKNAASHILKLSGNTQLICLIKPQFEVPRWKSDFSGVVEDMDFLLEVLNHVYDILKQDNVHIEDIIISPIKGRKGNIEFLSLLSKKEGISKEIFSNKILKLLSITNN
jgi:23S rRNA (cytidine1920-2'-O)/16S rRNA (cytidine1409-2'-O)-methyltransferase